MKHSLQSEHTPNEVLRLKLVQVAQALVERTAVAQAEEQAHQAALKQLEAAKAQANGELRQAAENKAAELAAVQRKLGLEREELRAQVERLRDELAAKQAQLEKARKLNEQQPPK